jgi:hypothetical protein
LRADLRVRRPSIQGRRELNNPDALVDSAHGGILSCGTLNDTDFT